MSRRTRSCATHSVLRAWASLSPFVSPAWYMHAGYDDSSMCQIFGTIIKLQRVQSAMPFGAFAI